MIRLRSLGLENRNTRSEIKLGSMGHLAIFAWSLGMVMLASARFLPITGGLCLLVAAAIHPRSFRRLMRLRWLGMIALLSLPPVFLLGELDRSLWGLSYSSTGLMSSLQIGLRIIVVLVAVDGLTAAVDIPSIAGILERLGLRGLGFSMGVALNLLPSLQQSALNAWHSLWMRGGLRKQRWRGLRLLLLTIITNALRRAEEIALAAEARAYSPERSRALPLKVGQWDRSLLAVVVVSLLSLLWLR